MKKISILPLIFLFVLMMGSCSDDSSPSGPDPDPTEEASAEKQFIWNAMNYWYYWQDDVPELADSFDDDDTEFQQYLKDYSDAEALFEDLQFSDDDFSFFIEDYEEFQDEQDGVFAALGFNYGFFFKTSQRQELVGYVHYVIPGMPADEAGLERLMIFTKVDGTTINGNNFNDLLADNAAHELTIAHIDTSSGQLSFPEDSTVSVASREVVEDPVYESTVIDTSGVKIGYLMYNAFQDNSHQRLNEVFGNFKSQNIDELILDLRYNGGGSVLTSQLLSSMISGLGNSDKYAEFSYNQKRAQRSQDVYFLDEVPIKNEDGDFVDEQGQFIQTEPINSLSLNNLYVLTSSGTASASEAVINGLKPYLNDVTLIGTKTIGKDEGSLTLYDAPAPYQDDEEANPDHKIAIQPIVLKIVNSEGEDYPNGFDPDGYTQNGCSADENDNCVTEITLENLQNKPAIGSPEEPLLARAIALITGQTTKRKFDAQQTVLKKMKTKDGIQNLRPHGNGMYIEPFMMSKPKEN